MGQFKIHKINERTYYKSLNSCIHWEWLEGFVMLNNEWSPYWWITSIDGFNIFLILNVRDLFMLNTNIKFLCYEILNDDDRMSVMNKDYINSSWYGSRKYCIHVCELSFGRVGAGKVIHSVRTYIYRSPVLRQPLHCHNTYGMALDKYIYSSLILVIS